MVSVGGWNEVWGQICLLPNMRMMKFGVWVSDAVGRLCDSAPEHLKHTVDCKTQGLLGLNTSFYRKDHEGGHQGSMGNVLLRRGQCGQVTSENWVCSSGCPDLLFPTPMGTIFGRRGENPVSTEMEGLPKATGGIKGEVSFFSCLNLWPMAFILVHSHSKIPCLRVRISEKVCCAISSCVSIRIHLLSLDG